MSRVLWPVSERADFDFFATGFLLVLMLAIEEFYRELVAGLCMMSSEILRGCSEVYVSR